jgi:ribosome-associated protein
LPAEQSEQLEGTQQASASTVPGASASPTRSAGGSSVGARDFAVEVARLLADTRCHQVAVLDVTGISPVTDYLVLSSGTSPRQMKSATEAAEEYGDSVGYRPLGQVVDSAHWVVMDFVDVVVHVFSQDARHYYDLDNLWGDARRVEWERVAGSVGIPSLSPVPRGEG